MGKLSGTLAPNSPWHVTCSNRMLKERLNESPWVIKPLDLLFYQLPASDAVAEWKENPVRRPKTWALFPGPDPGGRYVISAEGAFLPLSPCPLIYRGGREANRLTPNIWVSRWGACLAWMRIGVLGGTGRVQDEGPSLRRGPDRAAPMVQVRRPGAGDWELGVGGLCSDPLPLTFPMFLLLYESRRFINTLWIRVTFSVRTTTSSSSVIAGAALVAKEKASL